MLSPSEQFQIMAKINQILVYGRRTYGPLSRGEISQKTYKSTMKAMTDELKDLLKEAG